METTFKKITGKRFALTNSYFKNKKPGYPSTVLEITQYYKQHGELPFEYTGKNWLYQTMIERQKRFGVHSDQYLTPDKTAGQLVELTNNFIPDNNVVLDACCGTGQLTKYLLENNLKVIGFDKDREMVEICKLMYPDAVFHIYDFLKIESKFHFDLIVSNPPYSGKELTSFLKWLSSALTDTGKAIVLIPKDYMTKTRPKRLAEYIGRFNILHKESMTESFHHTTWSSEILILDLTEAYKKARKEQQGTIGQEQEISEPEPVANDNIVIDPKSEIVIQSAREIQNEHPIIETFEDKDLNPAGIQYIELDRIAANPLNPRKHFDEKAIWELSQSIAANGLLQSITLRPKGDKYEIVCGERRYRACSFLYSIGKRGNTMPAIVGDYTDRQVMEMALAENLERENLSAIEESNAFQYLIEQNEAGIDELIVRFGKTEKYIRSRLKLQNLITEFRVLMDMKELSISSGIELSKYSGSIQKCVYDEHYLTEGHMNWKDIRTKELSDRMIRLYTMELSAYKFDKSACKTCPFNTDTSMLFDDCKGKCTHIECLKEKQKAYTIEYCKQETAKDVAVVVCVTPAESIPSDMKDRLGESGVEVKTASRIEELPTPPKQPQKEYYKSEEAYKKALSDFEVKCYEYEEEMQDIEEKAARGEIQKVLRVGDNNPRICYVPVQEKDKRETAEDLKKEDEKNKEEMRAKVAKDAATILKSIDIPVAQLSAFEEEVLLYLLLEHIESKYFYLFGIADEQKKKLDEEDKKTIIQGIRPEQKGFLLRLFITKQLLMSFNASSKKQFIVTQMAQLISPEKTTEIYSKHKQVYDKQYERIKKKIEKLNRMKKKIRIEEAVI
ncbi:ParB/RepB/Spo0J family partition protein [Dysgonomonas sp. 25]|uniref:ParB/RepB/Spo0J family partition protein n=1 Tax=Dysgonomonas sp. 25 TaxID=2302933 RepID=UPI0013D54D08|nr:ParB/RepB/Spo0J family partition protein [Dysgonomonas sp. 25]NDV70021.1 ParB/RepB/Spo0J family partition protein [Dysgonomonas sp. 25]